MGRNRISAPAARNKIPLEARIVAIADTFDAVAHNRRYRKGRGIDDAIRVISEGRGTQFDPDVRRLRAPSADHRRASTREHIASGNAAAQRSSAQRPRIRVRTSAFAGARSHFGRDPSGRRTDVD